LFPFYDRNVQNGMNAGAPLLRRDAGPARALAAGGGYDTAIAEGGMPDATLIARSAAEARILVTRDRDLAAAAEVSVPVVRLAETDLAAQARALRIALGIDWQHAPFTRCLVDNAPLAPALPEMAEQVPPSSRAAGGPLRTCPKCGRLYWPGGHVHRMLARLAEWNALG
jgi:uncharacterized protein with PIN domain